MRAEIDATARWVSLMHQQELDLAPCYAYEPGELEPVFALPRVLVQVEQQPSDVNVARAGAAPAAGAAEAGAAAARQRRRVCVVCECARNLPLDRIWLVRVRLAVVKGDAQPAVG